VLGLDLAVSFFLLFMQQALSVSNMLLIPIASSYCAPMFDTNGWQPHPDVVYRDSLLPNANSKLKCSKQSRTPAYRISYALSDSQTSRDLPGYVDSFFTKE
jgi:hypothetical protein